MDLFFTFLYFVSSFSSDTDFTAGDENCPEYYNDYWVFGPDAVTAPEENDGGSDGGNGTESDYGAPPCDGNTNKHSYLLSIICINFSKS